MGSSFIPFPQAPQPQQGYTPPSTPAPQGTTPYAPSGVAQVFKGVNDFVQNFLSMKEAEKASNKQKFYEGVQNKMIGLPVDDRLLMKYAQKAGLGLRNEPYSPEEKQYLQDQQQNQDIQSKVKLGMDPTLSAMVPGAQQAYNQGAQQFSQPPQAPPGPPSPGIGQRIGQFFGHTPPPNPQGPAMQMLSQLGAASQIGGGLPGQVADEKNLSVMQRRFQGLDLGQKMRMVQLWSQAANGDPKAMDFMQRTGVMKELPGDEIVKDMQMAEPNTPRDQIEQKAGKLLLWLQTGGPQMLTHQQGLIKDLLPAFGNDIVKASSYVMDPVGAEQADIKPGLTPDQFEKKASAEMKIHEAYPTAPANLISMAGMAAMTGQTDTYQKVMDTLSAHYKPSGTIADEKFKQEQGTRNYEAVTGRMNANTNLGSLQQRIQNDAGLLSLAKLKVIAENAGEQGKLAMEILNNPKALDQDKKNALDMLASSVDKKAQLKVDYGGKTFSIADPVKAVQDSPIYRHLVPFSQTYGGATSGSLEQMKPDDAFWGGQAPPATYGSHPETTDILNKFKSLHQGLSQPEWQHILQRSMKPADPQGDILQFLRQQSGQ